MFLEDIVYIKRFDDMGCVFRLVVGVFFMSMEKKEKVEEKLLLFK